MSIVIIKYQFFIMIMIIIIIINSGRGKNTLFFYTGNLVGWFLEQLRSLPICTLTVSPQAQFVRSQAKDRSQQAVRVQTHVLEAKKK